MDRDTVVRLAKDSGFLGRTVFNHSDEIFRFATLIANETLERAAKVCETSDRYRGDYFADKVRALKE